MPLPVVPSIRAAGPLLLAGCLLVACQSPRPLFEEGGSDWITTGDATWHIDGDRITGTAEEQEGYLITRDTYTDFRLELEFYADSTLNSGVFVSCSGLEMNPLDCQEVNIWDRHPNQQYRTGAVVTKAVPLAELHTIGRWSTYRIESRNGTLSVFLNDTLTARLAEQARVAGHIGLQASGTGRIIFRNVRLRRW